MKEEKKRDRVRHSAAKAGTEPSARGAGAGIDAMMRAQRKYPNNPHKQVAAFLGEFTIKSGTGRKRPVSEATSDAYGDTLQLIIAELREDGAAVRNLSELGKAHLLRLIKRWNARQLSTSTIQNRLSRLRRFFNFIGKGHILPTAARLNALLLDNGISPIPPRSIVARESKAWKEKAVDFDVVLEKVRANCPTTALQLEFQAAFGLRVKESIMIKPHECDMGDHLRIKYGTKGGLERSVRFDNEEKAAAWQREILECAKLVADHHPKRILALRGRTLEQSLRHFYYQMRKIGVTRATLGVTAHGLRHEFAARRYCQVAGFEPPVSAGSPTVVNAMVKEADLEARKQVSLDMGHFRLDIAGAYIGTIPMAEKEKTQRLKATWRLTENNPRFVKAMADAGVSRVWLGENFAAGLPVAPNQKMRLFIATPGLKLLDSSILFRLKQELMDILGRGVDLTEHHRTTDPDDSSELQLPEVRDPQ
ncbi:hypothetical protein GCM10027399_21830 [Curvibacter fontanus]